MRKPRRRRPRRRARRPPRKAGRCRPERGRAIRIRTPITNTSEARTETAPKEERGGDSKTRADSRARGASRAVKADSKPKGASKGKEVSKVAKVGHHKAARVDPRVPKAALKVEARVVDPRVAVRVAEARPAARVVAVVHPAAADV